MKISNITHSGKSNFSGLRVTAIPKGGRKRKSGSVACGWFLRQMCL